MLVLVQTPPGSWGLDPDIFLHRTLEFGTQDSQAWGTVADDKSLKESPLAEAMVSQATLLPSPSLEVRCQLFPKCHEVFQDLSSQFVIALS